ncbi:hypothetical protein M433DRAFT_354877 [Acidomyces richmondensis BFW]|nr:hypothetical protein M433DRAFT_354877 [Acidomyces richmondensis BFW]
MKMPRKYERTTPSSSTSMCYPSPTCKRSSRPSPPSYVDGGQRENRTTNSFISINPAKFPQGLNSYTSSR